jgi:predicted ester cyclase
MTTEESRAFIARVTECIQGKDVTGLMREYAPACVLESPTAGGTVTGLDAIEQVYRAWFHAFPDLTVTSDQMMCDGDYVIHVMTLAGTDNGGFMGLQPSHRRFRIPLVSIYTVHDGRIVRERRVTDFTGFLVQIGVLKARPA